MGKLVPEGKSILDFTEVCDDGVAVTSAGAYVTHTPCSRQTTMPASHHSVFYRPDVIPVTQLTVSNWGKLKLPYFIVQVITSTHTKLPMDNGRSQLVNILWSSHLWSCPFRFWIVNWISVNQYSISESIINETQLTELRFNTPLTQNRPFRITISNCDWGKP